MTIRRRPRRRHIFAALIALAAAGIIVSPTAGAPSAPAAGGCATVNTVQRENCLSGSTGWKAQNPLAASNGGIEGFAIPPSVDAGQSVNLKINTAAGVPYHIDVYRMGWYGAAQGRL